MKTLKLTFLSLAVTLFAASCGGSDATDATVSEEVAPAVEETAPATSDLSVNTEASVINWKGSKLTGSAHNGTLKLSEGTLKLDGDKLVSGNFVIDMTTLANEDLAGTDMYEKLIGHLKSPDFFSVDSFQTATFVITGAAPAAEGTEATHSISGNLTMKGITKNITFPATVSVKDGSVNATATFAIDRTEWNIRYGSKDHFPDLVADKAINNDLELTVVLVAGGTAAM